jgi:hypothetical protein
MDLERGRDIANSKSQINPTLKCPMTKTVLFGISNFGDWNLFVIWCLEFGAYSISLFTYGFLRRSLSLSFLHP